MKIFLYIQAAAYLTAHAHHFGLEFHQWPQNDAELISDGIALLLLGLAQMAPTKK